MWSSSVRSAIPCDVPVDPSAPEARQWAETELSRAIYDQTPSVWDRLVSWFVQWVSDLLSGMPAGGSPLVPIVILAATTVAVLLVLAHGGRLQQRTRARPSSPLFDDARTAEHLRADAAAAARRGDWEAATLDQFRAIIRSLDERAILDDRPGLTAWEASRAAELSFPALGTLWRQAASTFDAVRYGHTPAKPEDHHRMLALDEAVTGALPVGSAP